MPERERIEQAVYGAVDVLNRQLPGGIRLEKSPDAPLYGRAGKLESLDFVTFIMEVESRIKGEFGVDLVLSDENLLSRESSPFSTLGNLIRHLETILGGE